MYGLPVDFDASFLIGRTLEQVCFTANQVIFNFDAGVRIVVEAAFSVALQGATSLRIVEVPCSDSDVMRLLERRISDASGSRDGTLTVTFVDEVLAIYDNSREYESYQIWQGDTVLYV